MDFKARRVWEKMARELSESGLPECKKFDWKICSNKWKSLTSAYRKIVDHNASTGRDTKHFSFEEELSEVYGYRRSVNPVATCSAGEISTAGNSSTDRDARRSRHGRFKNMHRRAALYRARPAPPIGSARSKKMAPGHLHVDPVSVPGLSTTAFPWGKKMASSRRRFWFNVDDPALRLRHCGLGSVELASTVVGSTSLPLFFLRWLLFASMKTGFTWRCPTPRDRCRRPTCVLCCRPSCWTSSDV